MNRRDPSSLLRAMFRSARFVLVYQGAGLAVVVLSLLPATRSLLGVSASDVMRAMGAIMGSNLASTWAFHARGEESRTYRLIASGEMISYQAAMMWLIYRSGSGVSFAWLMWLGQAAANTGIIEHSRAMLTLYTSAPLVLALCFLVLRGDATSAVASVLGALVGLVVFGAGLRNNLRLAEAHAQREAALAELADLRVRDERLRIARDLHDGVAADLTAMAMRADRARVAPADARERELDLLATRSREAIDDLRTIVWSMRSPERSPTTLASYLEQRCRELCGHDVAFQLRADVERGHPLSGERALDVLRIAQECCRNAVRHASPSQVSIELRIDDHISLVVEDDGSGLPEGVELSPEGGLANIRQRVEPGGTVAVRRLAPGTRIEVRLPA